MWERLKRIGMVALFGLFTLAGAAITLFGQGTDRLLGIAVLLMFGGGGLGWFIVTSRPPGGGQRLRIGTVATFGRYEAGFIADYDAARQMVGGGVAVLMAGAFALMAFIPGDEGEPLLHPLLGVGGALLFAAVGGYGLLNARRGSRLVFTPRGVTAFSSAGPIATPWTNVTRLGYLEVHGSPF
ncbi:MAG TPA: hypothetical protein VHK63_05490, partial [Candidatus Limnocylindria bacterium]|nr:hypothetical protein [Candidatus Limnocylindria bacterium]